jgi:hypothetical protein
MEWTRKIMIKNATTDEWGVFLLLLLFFLQTRFTKILTSYKLALMFQYKVYIPIVTFSTLFRDLLLP